MKPILSVRGTALNLACLTYVFAASVPAQAALHLGISGGQKTETWGTERESSHQGKGTVSVDLSSYFRLSVTGARSYSKKEGFKRVEATDNYFEFKENSVQNALSVDIVAILYANNHIMPFVFGGMVQRWFHLKLTEGGVTSSTNGVIPWMPNYGIGANIALSNNFSLKISHTVSMGAAQSPLVEKDSTVWDSSTDVGITYQLSL